MAATVTVRAKAFGDPRITFLAQLLGCSRNEAFMRMVQLWGVCAEEQTDKPEVRRIRACLENIQGEKLLVESGLGDDIADPSLVVVRVRGCDETDWYYALIELQGQVEAGRARAATAARDAKGRFLDPVGDRSSQSPASDLSGSGSGSPDPIRPELPESGETVRAEREAAPLLPGIRNIGPARTNTERRNKLVNDAWNYAALVHTQLKADGVDKHARNCWSGTNIAEARRLLVAIVEDLAQGDAPNWTAAQDTIRNRVDVAAAAARREKTLRWFTPMRMWDPTHFAKDAEQSPEQAAQPRRPNNPEPAAAPARRMKTF